MLHWHRMSQCFPNRVAFWRCMHTPHSPSSFTEQGGPACGPNCGRDDHSHPDRTALIGDMLVNHRWIWRGRVVGSSVLVPDGPTEGRFLPHSRLPAMTTTRSLADAVRGFRRSTVRARKPRRCVPAVEAGLEGRLMLSGAPFPAAMLPAEVVGSSTDMPIPGPKDGSTHEITVGPDGTSGSPSSTRVGWCG